MINIKEALTLEGLKYFYTQHIKPLKTRLSQLGTAANCSVVNNATTTVANTVLDGRMGKTLNDKIDSVAIRVSNHFNRTGAECSSGGYNTDWNLSTEYYNIGNSLDLVDNLYYKSFSDGGIQVKEGGLYLVLLQSVVYCNGNSKLWGQLKKDGVNTQDYIYPISYDTVFQGFYCGYLYSGQKLTFLIAKSTDDTTVTAKKGQSYMQVIKLT